jgi:hypothetical protein
MAAVAGILGTELLGLPKWYEAGAASDIPTAPLAATTFLFTGAAETFRYKGWKETGTVGGRGCGLGGVGWGMPNGTRRIEGEWPLRVGPNMGISWTRVLGSTVQRRTARTLKASHAPWLPHGVASASCLMQCGLRVAIFLQSTTVVTAQQHGPGLGRLVGPAL